MKLIYTPWFTHRFVHLVQREVDWAELYAMLLQMYLLAKGQSVLNIDTVSQKCCWLLGLPSHYLQQRSFFLKVRLMVERHCYSH